MIVMPLSRNRSNSVPVNPPCTNQDLAGNNRSKGHPQDLGLDRYNKTQLITAILSSDFPTTDGRNINPCHHRWFVGCDKNRTRRSGGHDRRLAVKWFCNDDEFWLWLLSPIEASLPIGKFCAVATLASENVVMYVRRALNRQKCPRAIRSRTRIDRCRGLSNRAAEVQTAAPVAS